MNDNKIIFFPMRGWRASLRGDLGASCQRLADGLYRYEDVSFNEVGHVVAACLDRLPRSQKYIHMTLVFPETESLSLARFETRQRLTNENGRLMLPFETGFPADLPNTLAAYMLEVVAGHREPEVVCTFYRDGVFDLSSDWSTDFGLPAAALRQGKQWVRSDRLKE